MTPNACTTLCLLRSFGRARAEPAPALVRVHAKQSAQDTWARHMRLPDSKAAAVSHAVACVAACAVACAITGVRWRVVFCRAHRAAHRRGAGSPGTEGIRRVKARRSQHHARGQKNEPPCRVCHRRDARVALARRLGAHPKQKKSAAHGANLPNANRGYTAYYLNNHE